MNRQTIIQRLGILCYLGIENKMEEPIFLSSQMIYHAALFLVIQEDPTDLPDSFYNYINLLDQKFDAHKLAPLEANNYGTLKLIIYHNILKQADEFSKEDAEKDELSYGMDAFDSLCNYLYHAISNGETISREMLDYCISSAAYYCKQQNFLRLPYHFEDVIKACQKTLSIENKENYKYALISAFITMRTVRNTIRKKRQAKQDSNEIDVLAQKCLLESMENHPLSFTETDIVGLEGTIAVLKSFIENGYVSYQKDRNQYVLTLGGQFLLEEMRQKTEANYVKKL